VQLLLAADETDSGQMQQLLVSAFQCLQASTAQLRNKKPQNCITIQFPSKQMVRNYTDNLYDNDSNKNDSKPRTSILNNV